jgi:hypothetical protein
MDDSDRDIRCYGQALLSFIAGERIQEVSVLRRSFPTPRLNPSPRAGALESKQGTRAPVRSSRAEGCGEGRITI